MLDEEITRQSEGIENNLSSLFFQIRCAEVDRKTQIGIKNRKINDLERELIQSKARSTYYNEYIAVTTEKEDLSRHVLELIKENELLSMRVIELEEVLNKYKNNID